MAAIAPSNSRGMGWRKPVPVFVPTPPHSRPTSGGLFTPASAVSGGDTGKQPPAGVPEGGLPPVSPLSPHPSPLVRAEGELTSFKMPDNWLSIVRSVSQGFYHDSTRFHLTARTTIPETQPVCAVCQRLWSAAGPAAHSLFPGVLPDYVFDDGRSPPTYLSVSLCAQGCSSQGTWTFFPELLRDCL